MQDLTKGSTGGHAPGTTNKLLANHSYIGETIVATIKTLFKLYSNQKRETIAVNSFYLLVAAKGDPEVHLGQLRRFPLRELQVATDNFSNRNILGRGGFGKVYKGRLADGSLVAVKRLKEELTQGGELQFQTEVEMISMAVHQNLLRLCGYCMTPTERLLVYPYMANGSVASCLRGNTWWPLYMLFFSSLLLFSGNDLAPSFLNCTPFLVSTDVNYNVAL